MLNSAQLRPVETVSSDAGPPEVRPGWRERLFSRLAAWRPRRKRVLVGTDRRAGVLDQTLSQLHPMPRGDLTFLDARRLDGRLTERLRMEGPDEVYFDLGADIDEHVITRAGARLLMDGVSVHFVLPQPGRPPVRAEATRVGSHSVLSLHAVGDSLAGRIVRRALDLAGTTVLLLLLAPVIATVAALVRWRMGGPVLHAQQRVGKGGRPFRLYKFRSMVVDAEQRLRASPEVYQRYVAANFKLPVDEDPRITPLGRLLRRTSLDELPQLWNVLRGEMSLIGPRAIVPEEVAQYGEYERMLLRIKPGLTGLWQVSGRSSIGYPERAHLDLQYVQGRSLGKDLRILLRTLPAVILQRGAL